MLVGCVQVEDDRAGEHIVKASTIFKNEHVFQIKTSWRAGNIWSPAKEKNLPLGDSPVLSETLHVRWYSSPPINSGCPVFLEMGIQERKSAYRFYAYISNSSNSMQKFN